ncbi:MAG: hypothetical protein ACI9GC_001163 [Phycisphaerales bacterium]|jgi:hypothetical protein
MSNHDFFNLYIVCWILYLVFVYVYGYRNKLEPTILTFSHVLPSTIALTMIYIFVIKHGASTAQFVAGLMKDLSYGLCGQTFFCLIFFSHLQTHAYMSSW